MKNLKKINREAQKQIQGSGIIKRCTEHYQCPGGACCRNVCVLNPCAME